VVRHCNELHNGILEVESQGKIDRILELSRGGSISTPGADKGAGGIKHLYTVVPRIDHVEIAIIVNIDTDRNPEQT